MAKKRKEKTNKTIESPLYFLIKFLLAFGVPWEVVSPQRYRVDLTSDWLTAPTEESKGDLNVQSEGSLAQ